MYGSLDQSFHLWLTFLKRNSSRPGKVLKVHCARTRSSARSVWYWTVRCRFLRNERAIRCFWVLAFLFYIVLTYILDHCSDMSGIINKFFVVRFWHQVSFLRENLLFPFISPRFLSWQVRDVIRMTLIKLSHEFEPSLVARTVVQPLVQWVVDRGHVVQGAVWVVWLPRYCKWLLVAIWRSNSK